MKKIFLTLAVMTVAAAGVSSARAGVEVSIGIRAPVYAYAAPVYYPSPRVGYAQPPPVVVYRAPAPVYYAPASVYCAPAPVYCAPAPVVRLRFGFHPFYRHGRW